MIPALLVLAGSTLTARTDLVITNARVGELLPGSNRTAAYCDVANNGGRDLVLTGAYSDSAGAIELHRTFNDGAIVHMERRSEVAVPAGQTVRFQPGGLHLMLFRVEQLAPTVTITLTFRDGEEIPVVFTTLGAQQR